MKEIRRSGENSERRKPAENKKVGQGDSTPEEVSEVRKKSVRKNVRRVGPSSNPAGGTTPKRKPRQPDSPISGAGERRSTVEKAQKKAEERAKLDMDRQLAIRRGMDPEEWDREFGDLRKGLEEGQKEEEMRSWSDYEEIKKEVEEESQQEQWGTQFEEGNESWEEAPSLGFDQVVAGTESNDLNAKKARKALEKAKKKGLKNEDGEYEVGSDAEAKKAMRVAGAYVGIAVFLITFLALVMFFGGPSIFKADSKIAESNQSALEAKSKELDERGVTLGDLVDEAEGRSNQEDIKKRQELKDKLVSEPPSAGQKVSADGTSVDAGFKESWKSDSAQISNYINEKYPFTAGFSFWKVGEKGAVSDVESKSTDGKVFQVEKLENGQYRDNAQAVLVGEPGEWIQSMAGDTLSQAGTAVNGVSVQIDNSLTDKTGLNLKDSNAVFGKYVTGVNFQYTGQVPSADLVTQVFTGIDSGAADLQKTFPVQFQNGRDVVCFMVKPNGIATAGC